MDIADIVGRLPEDARSRLFDVVVVINIISSSFSIMYDVSSSIM